MTSHEGSYVVKRGSWYYYTFADVSRNGKPTCIGYAMSKSPMGPYEYKGVIIDNNGCDPSVWNNHGSLVEFKDKWYVLYHRATHSSVSMRKACIEPITFREDGTIEEAEIPAHANWTDYTVKTQKTNGVHALWLTFEGEKVCDKEELMQIDWIKFK